jgi:hypothetical protein
MRFETRIGCAAIQFLIADCKSTGKQVGVKIKPPLHSLLGGFNLNLITMHTDVCYEAAKLVILISYCNGEFRPKVGGFWTGVDKSTNYCSNLQLLKHRLFTLLSIVTKT